ncbi:hypothetical protein C8A05DRAFT_30239, partial [Staphylotrichum tortipilum]
MSSSHTQNQRPRLDSAAHHSSPTPPPAPYILSPPSPSLPSHPSPSHPGRLPVSPPTPPTLSDPDPAPRQQQHPYLDEDDDSEDDSVLNPPPTVARSYGRPVIIEGPYRHVPGLPSSPPSQQQPWAAAIMNPAMLTDFRDELARLDGVITPGVDNTPFVQYAIEALTRDRDTGYSGAPGSASRTSTPGFALPPPGQPSHQHYQPIP